MSAARQQAEMRAACDRIRDEPARGAWKTKRRSPTWETSAGQGYARSVRDLAAGARAEAAGLMGAASRSAEPETATRYRRTADELTAIAGELERVAGPKGKK